MIAARGAVETWRRGDDPGPLLERLARGGIVAFPTESSYGLGVDPMSETGVSRLYQVKGRPAEKALPVVAASVETLYPLGVVPGSPALRWGRERWPAALSVVVPLAAPIAASAGRCELAVRIPADDELRALLAIVGRPITATSANPAGAEPYLEPGRVRKWLVGAGADAVVVGDGPAPGGPPSTLVALEEGRPRLIRAGRFPIS